MPVSLPFNSGSTRATAFAAPVELGMMFMYALRPPRQSFLLGPSCVGWVAVTAWIVAIKPSVSWKLSLMTFAIGARQLVVQLALLTILSFAGSYFVWFTPTRYVGIFSGSFVGAEIMTRFAPAFRCCSAPA